MSVLLVELGVRSGEETRLAEAFTSTFRPAVSAQPGFRSVRLLRPAAEGGLWFLEIEFVDEERRLAWVGTDLHQEVWPRIDTHCDSAVPAVFEPTE